jgi:hypothetical protein
MEVKYMRVAGMSIQGKTCSIVVLDNSSGTFRIKKAMEKVSVANTNEQEELKTFFKTISAFVRDECIEKIHIKQRSKKGSFAGGADGFKLEALVQLLDIDVAFISPVAIGAKFKNSSVSQIEEVYAYQEEALKSAITGIAKDARNRT